MKTTIEIADDLLERAKGVARRDGCTLRDLTEEGLLLALARRKRRPATRVKLHTVGGRSDPSLARWENMVEAIYGDGKLPTKAE